MATPVKISTPITTKQYALPAINATSVATTAATNSTPYGYSQAQANALVTTVNQLLADVTDLKQVMATLLGELEARNAI